jgi:hypothetical protein
LEYVFLVIALAWGVAQVFLVPPLQVPDEGDHWFRAWALTDGQLTADRDGMVTLPASFARTADLYTRLVADGVPPVSLEGQAGFAGYEDLFNSPGPSGTVRVASRVLSYGPVGYLPQAVGVGLGRLVGAPPLTCFYLARLGNLFAAAALLFFAIRLAPFGKHLFACDALTISVYLNVQGRYLAPIWLLLALSVYGIAFARRHLGQLFVVGVLLVMMAQNLDTLISYYHP